MKKQLLALGLLFASFAQAQNDAVTNAFFFNKDGELDKAKEEIDKAAVHEKTKEKAKTWYFRGLIYEGILGTKNPKFATLAPNAGKETYDSYTKAMALSKKGEEYFDESIKRLGNLWGTFLNDGVKKYQADDFAGSIVSYELAQTIKPEDTTAFVYGLYSAERLKDYEKTKAYTRQLFALGKNLPYMYISISRLAKELDKKDSALKHIQEGRLKYPNNRDLALEELDLFFALGRGGEAKTKLEEAVKMDSSNASLFAILGNLYDQESADKNLSAKDKEVSKQKALKAYRKALTIDPKNMESNFNLGVYYFNRGAEIIKKVNDLDINAYQKSGKKLEADAQAEFKLALPFFEACYAKDPKDESVKKSLKNTYERVGRKADADKIPD
jgi:Flp pilus assembly protein TadD